MTIYVRQSATYKVELNEKAKEYFEILKINHPEINDTDILFDLVDMGIIDEDFLGQSAILDSETYVDSIEI